MMSTNESARAFLGHFVPTLTPESFRRRYRLGAELGSGLCATTRRAIQLSTGTNFAVKMIDKSWARSLRDPRCNARTLEAEIVIHASLTHPNVAKFHEALQDDKYFYIVMELCAHGSFRSLREGPRTIQACLYIAKQIFEAVRYLQSMGVAHRDLHWENIMFIENDQVKVVDFGRSIAADLGRFKNRFAGARSLDLPSPSNEERPSTVAFRKDIEWDTHLCGKYLQDVLECYRLYRQQQNEPEAEEERRIRKAMTSLARNIKISDMTIRDAVEAVQKI